MATTPETILKYLADLAPEPKRTTDVVRRATEFVYLGWQPYLLQPGQPPGAFPLGSGMPRKDLRRLAALDALHSTEQLLRLGWLFVTGTIDIDGKQVRFCKPLLSVPVRVRVTGFEVRIQQVGDIEMPADLFDEPARDELEESEDPFGGGADEPSEEILHRMPKLQRWVATALTRAKLPAAPIRTPTHNPLDLRSEVGLAVVAGAAVYTARDTSSPGLAGTLLGWASQELSGTALDALYGGDTADVVPTESSEIRTPLPLNARQREALQRARNERVTAVSGPPGTGKSHLVAALAIDEVSRGNSVLVATQSDYAAEVITDLLDRHPGPRYVRFGRREDRESAATELADGMAVPLSNEAVRQLEEETAATARELARTRNIVGRLLEREAAFSNALRQRDFLSVATAQAPKVLDPEVDLDAASRLLAKASSTSGFFVAWRRTRSDRKLRRLIGARDDASLGDLEMAIDGGRAEAAIRTGLEGGGLTLDSAWDELERTEEMWRSSTGMTIEATRRSRSNSRRVSIRAVGSLATALRAGRVQRRRILRELTGDHFLDVLPLWIGTLKEIDDTLPVASGMFDVVIFDEASQIDQQRAAPALARARRAVIVGDPRQLRHISFTADLAIEETAARYGIAGTTARLLDIRRNSLFDAAATDTPVTWLDEHFRSVPHLIGFSDRKFYNGRLKLMTQHPATESQDAIHTIPVGGSRDESGVNIAEVNAVREEINRLARRGVSSIGIVTPFRAQADALEAMLLGNFEPEDTERLGLRVGTVHAFQGNEREIIIVSLAMTNHDLSNSLRFVENPNLFNVMVTRAKREMKVLHSFEIESLPAGLLKDYFRHGGHPPRPLESTTQPGGWTGELLEHVRQFSVPAVAGYPVAGWTVDMTIGTGPEAFGVECSVHPDGPDSHIERHQALRRAGWVMTDSFQSRWLTRAEAGAESLARRYLGRVPQD